MGMKVVRFAVSVELDPGGTSEHKKKREEFLGQDVDPPECDGNWFVSLIGAGDAKLGHSSETVDRDLYGGKLP